jgi:monofunctional chorismate mutase
MKLDILRKKINTVDLKIIHLLQQRVLLVKEIAREKKSQKIPIIDKEREKEVLSSVINEANKYNIDTFFIRKLFINIMKHSKIIQNEKQ